MVHTRARLAAAAAISLLSLAGCGEDDPAPVPPPAAVDAARSTLEASPAAVADGTTPVTLTATARDAGGAALAGRVAVFTVGGAQTTLSAPSATTDASGVASVTVTATIAGARDASVVVDGVAVTWHASAEFVPGPAASLVFAVQPTPAVAGDLLAPAVEVAAFDAHGNLVADPVDVSLALAGGAALHGTATATVVGGHATFADLSVELAGTHALTASADGVPAATSDAFEITPATPDAAASAAFAAPATLAAGERAAVSATIRDAYGNAVPGVAVAFESSGSDDAFDPPSATTDADGVASATLTSTRAEPKTITARAGALAISDRPSVTFTAGPPDAAGSSIAASAASAPDDGTAIALTVTVGDRWGNPVAGQAVTLAATGGATVVQPAAPTSGAGSTSGSVSALAPGASTVSASAGAALVAQRGVAFTAAPPDAQATTVVAVPSVIPSDGVTPSNVTVSVKDVLRRPVAGAAVKLSYSAAATITPDVATSDAAGAATFQVTSSAPASGTLAAKATPAGETAEVAVADHPPLTVEDARYAVGGAVFGLSSAGLVLASEGLPDLAVPANATSFAFGLEVPSGTAYAVTVKTQPAGQTCAVLNGAGVVTGAAATGIVVDCEARWKQVAAGQYHALLLRADGALFTLGYNWRGAIGDGTLEPRSTPYLIGTGFSSVAAGGWFSLALKADGSLWTWGDNYYGELGDGTWVDRTTPVQIGTGFASVAAGWTHAAALKADGSLYLWGSNTSGQLGDGTTTNRNRPLLRGTGFAAVGMGYGHTVALKRDGSVVAWGDNAHGDLGNGSTTASTSPVLVGTGFTSIAVAMHGGFGLKAGGALYAWGYNEYGQLGDGSTTNRSSPVLVGTGYAAVAAGPGANQTLAVQSDGSLWAWGTNSCNELGIGGAVTGVQTCMAPLERIRTSPVNIGTGFASVAAGGSSSYAITTDGALWNWGDNSWGQLGEVPDPSRTSPTRVGTGFVAVAAGAKHTLALKTDGSLYAWGENMAGQVGDGTQIIRISPVLVGTGFRSIAAGHYHSLGLKTDGSLYAWGGGCYGELGIGIFGAGAQRPSPTLVASGFDAIAAGGQYSLARKPDGSLWAWGRNASGQLGVGSTTDLAAPTLVGTGFASVAAGYAHALAVKEDGTLYAWGDNTYGQLGDGSTTSRTSPVSLGSGFASVAAGFYYTVALKTEGTLYAWGDNSYGQLGVDATSVASSSTPIRIGTGYASVAAGGQHTLAVKRDGTLWVWGDGQYGQIGWGGNVGTKIPMPPDVVASGFTAVSGGAYHSLGLRADGSLWAWGQGASGELGLGKGPRAVPTRFSFPAAPLVRFASARRWATVAQAFVAAPVNAAGPVTSWGIAPALPAGLAFDATTGTISGTPAAASPPTSYEVTATSPRGGSTTLVTIQVN